MKLTDWRDKYLDKFGTTPHKGIEEFITELLSQQRQEILEEKIQVVYNDVCKQIKHETLEEVEKILVTGQTLSDGEFLRGYNRRDEEIKAEIKSLKQI